MIINETKYTYDDIKLLYEGLKKSVLFWIFRIILAGLGIFSLYSAYNMIYKNLEWFKNVWSEGKLDTDGWMTILIIFLDLVLGIVLLIFSLIAIKLLSKRFYKKRYKNASARHMEFREDIITVSSEKDGIKTDATLEYETVISYVERNDSISIEFEAKDKGGKRFMLVHNDSYKVGSKEELIALLNRKGCKAI